MRTLSGMKQWIKAARGPSAGSPSSCAATTTMWPNSGETFLYVAASQKHMHGSICPFYISLFIFDCSLLIPVVPQCLFPSCLFFCNHIKITVILFSIIRYYSIYLHINFMVCDTCFYSRFCPTSYIYLFLLSSLNHLISMCSLMPKRLHCTYFPFSSLSQTLFI